MQNNNLIIDKPVEADLVDRILAKELYAKALGTVYSHLIFGTIFLFLFYSKVELSWLIIWGGVLFSNAIIRFLFIRHWLKMPENQRDQPWMSRMAFMTSLVNGLLWASTVFFLDFYHLPFESVATSIMVFGLAAAAAVYSAYFLPAFYLAVTPYIGSYILYHTTQLTYESALMAVVFGVFGLMLYSQATQLNTTHRKNIAQRIENDHLIEALKESSLEYKKESNTDFLTGVHNRRYFDRMIKMLWKRHLIDEKPLCIVMCDIDNFKTFNDSYGHAAGDEILRQVTKLILDNIRYSDSLCCYGGEEFVLVLPETALDEGCEKIERLRQKIEQHSFVIGDQKHQITLSFGVSSRVPFNMEDYQELVALADQLMYQSKQTGRNNVTVQVTAEEA